MESQEIHRAASDPRTRVNSRGIGNRLASLRVRLSSGDSQGGAAPRSSPGRSSPGECQPAEIDGGLPWRIAGRRHMIRSGALTNGLDTMPPDRRGTMAAAQWMRGSPAVVLGLHRRVALAGGPDQAVQIGDSICFAAVMDEVAPLQRVWPPAVRLSRRAPIILRHRFLGQHELVAAGQVAGRATGSAPAGASCEALQPAVYWTCA